MRLNQFTVLAILSYCVTTIAHKGRVGTTNVADTFKHSVDSIAKLPALTVKRRGVESAGATLDTSEAAARGKKRRRKGKKSSRTSRRRIFDDVKILEDAGEVAKPDFGAEGNPSVDVTVAKGKKKHREG
ncbi:hypothetical protein E2P81_ATG08408 [Venturia nashicola]|nr:hypothetical protein E2P81_ATG08408 [Venturia nashicola]